MVLFFLVQGRQIPLRGRAIRRGQSARQQGRLYRPSAGESEPSAPPCPYRYPYAGGRTGAHLLQYRVCSLLLQGPCRPRHGTAGARHFAKRKAGTAAGFQLFRAVAAARQGAAVHPGTLHRAPGGRRRKALRGQAGNFGQRQPLGAGAARFVQRAVRVSGRLRFHSGVFLFSAGAEVLFFLPLRCFLPGVFVCVAVHLPELLPPQLLYKIEAAEKATPLPLFAEMLLVILLLEIIREAGLRMPQSLGHSVSLVSALIIGDAAIATGLMSTPVIFVASITAIAVFVTPGLYEPATLLRIGTGAVGRACRTSGTGSSVFRLFAQPRQHRSIGCAVSCAAPLPAAAAFRGRRSAPQLPAAVPAGVQYLAKGGRGGKRRS